MAGESTPTGLAAVLERRRVLIVEDEELLSKTIAEILSAQGADCQIIASKSVAREALKRFKPTLVILDFRLVGGSGLGIARLSKNRNIPIILVSGYELGDVAAAEGLTFLRKPFTPGELLSSVSNVLRS
jgi:DNA-binding response OmpR family regulator